jgi:hypothetical protein
MWSHYKLDTFCRENKQSSKKLSDVPKANHMSQTEQQVPEFLCNYVFTFFQVSTKNFLRQQLKEMANQKMKAVFIPIALSPIQE